MSFLSRIVSLFLRTKPTAQPPAEPRGEEEQHTPVMPEPPAGWHFVVKFVEHVIVVVLAEDTDTTPIDISITHGVVVVNYKWYSTVKSWYYDTEESLSKKIIECASSALWSKEQADRREALAAKFEGSYPPKTLQGNG